MRYTESPQAAEQLVAAIEQTLDEERGGGDTPHVSYTIYCLKKSWRRRHGWPVPPEDFNHRLILLVGQALHAIHAKAGGARLANVKLVTPWLVGSADARLAEGGRRSGPTTLSRSRLTSFWPANWDIRYGMDYSPFSILRSIQRSARPRCGSSTRSGASMTST